MSDDDVADQEALLLRQFEQFEVRSGGGVCYGYDYDYDLMMRGQGRCVHNLSQAQPNARMGLVGDRSHCT